MCRLGSPVRVPRPETSRVAPCDCHPRSRGDLAWSWLRGVVHRVPHPSRKGSGPVLPPSVQSTSHLNSLRGSAGVKGVTRRSEGGEASVDELHTEQRGDRVLGAQSHENVFTDGMADGVLAAGAEAPRHWPRPGHGTHGTTGERRVPSPGICDNQAWPRWRLPPPTWEMAPLRSEPDRTAVDCDGTATAPSLRRPLILGLVASVAIVCGALAGGRMFVSTLPGAWFFGPTTSAAGGGGPAARARPDRRLRRHHPAGPGLARPAAGEPFASLGCRCAGWPA